MILELTLSVLLSAPQPGDAAPAGARRAGKRGAAPQPAATQPATPPPATPAPVASPAPAPAPAPVEDTPDEDAAVLQARALLAEHDGKLADALTLLRQAHERSPGNGDVAYDLARVAALEAGPRAAFAARDVDPFLSRTAGTAPERILRGYLLARGGDVAGAREQLASVARLEPGRGELAGFEPPPRGLAAALHLGLFGQYDSNVLLVAGGAPSDVGGPRMSLDADAELSFGEAAPWLRAGAFGRVGVHAANRANLGGYDSGSFGLFVRATNQAGPVDYDVMLTGTDVGINNDAGKQFMQEGAVRGTATLASGALRPGVFVSGGYRNFDALNGEGDQNRDGPFGAGGLLVEWGARSLAVAAQVGFQLEQAQGSEQRERGVVAGVLARTTLGSLVASAGVDYQLRDYASGRSGRRDSLVTPSLSVSAPAMAGLRLAAGYSFTKNVSSAGFGYDRHLAQLGVEGQW